MKQTVVTERDKTLAIVELNQARAKGEIGSNTMPTAIARCDVENLGKNCPRPRAIPRARSKRKAAVTRMALQTPRLESLPSTRTCVGLKSIVPCRLTDLELSGAPRLLPGEAGSCR